jgi:hypothetical protein
MAWALLGLQYGYSLLRGDRKDAEGPPPQARRGFRRGLFPAAAALPSGGA